MQKAVTKKKVTPTSFRLTRRALDALDRGAERFHMTRAQWLEFLAVSAVSEEKASIVTDHASIEIQGHEKCSK